MDLFFPFVPPSPIFRNQGHSEIQVFGRNTTITSKNIKYHANIFNGVYSRDPYLSSGILYMPVMSTLLAINMDLVEMLLVEIQKNDLF